MNGYKQALVEIWKWLKNQQKANGGFPPYPQFINEPATIASADFVGLLFRRCSIQNCGDLQGAGDILEKTKKFISDMQLFDGGFAPNGDIYAIKDISFVESTASCITAFLVYLRSLNAEGQSKASETKISILRGVKYLLDTKAEDMWPNYTTTLKVEDEIFRFFPFIAAMRALVLFFDLSDNLAFKKFISNRFIGNVLTVIQEGTRKIVDLLINKKYLPFSTSPQASISYVNTINALEVLISVFNSDKIYKEDETIKKMKEAFHVGLSSILDYTESNNDNMDEDVILLNIPSYPSKYTATYRRDLAISYVFSGTLLESKSISIIKNISSINSKEALTQMRNYVKAVADKEVRKMNKEKRYYSQERRFGVFVPAISATCLLFAILKNCILLQGGGTTNEQ